MQTEIEAKFLSVDHDALRRKLKQAGAELVQPKRLMRRNNYDYADGRLQKIGGWVRVRDEGHKVTLSYKQLNDRSLHGTEEVNLAVDSFEQAGAFLTAIGLEIKNHQESKRESWKIGDVEIELDEWPWIRPFAEIEGPDESSVREVAKKLRLDWSSALHGSVEVAYQAEYDVTDEEIYAVAKMRFDDPPPKTWKRRA